MLVLVNCLLNQIKLSGHRQTVRFVKTSISLIEGQDAQTARSLARSEWPGSILDSGRVEFYLHTIVQLGKRKQIQAYSFLYTITPPFEAKPHELVYSAGLRRWLRWKKHMSVEACLRFQLSIALTALKLI